MDTITNYRNIIKHTLQHYANTRIPFNNPNPGYQLIFDTERDIYMLYRVGWQEEIQRIHFCVFHLDIKDGKVWVQRDATDCDIVGELEEQGIPKSDMYLLFKHLTNGLIQGTP
jgi:hypothetical protein